MSRSDAPLEKEIQAAILKYLKGRPGGFSVKLAAGPYTLPGLPDILHVEGGVPYFIEVKRPGGKPTKLQAAVMDKLSAAGAVVAVATAVEEVKTLVKGRQKA